MTTSHEKPARATFLDSLSSRTLSALEAEGLDLDAMRRQLADLGDDYRIDAGPSSPSSPTKNRRPVKAPSNLPMTPFGKTPPESSPAPRPPKRERRIARIVERERRKRPRMARNEKKDRIYLARLQRRLEAAYGQGKAIPPPVLIPSRIWHMAWHILADHTGQAAAAYLARCNHQIGAQIVRRAALAPDEAGKNRYSWTDKRARAVAALGLAIIHMAGKTRRLGPWNRLILGVPVGAFMAALRDPYTGKKPSRSTLTGRHTADATLENGQLGFLIALSEAGLFYSQQVPRSVALPQELIGPSGFPTARYWLISADPLRRQTPEERFRALELLEKELETRRINRRNHSTAHTTETGAGLASPPELAGTGTGATGPPADTS